MPLHASGERHALVIDLDRPGKGPSFHPDRAIGAGIDGGHAGDMDRLFTPRNVAAMKRAGLRALTYRLRTELGIEAWHWNPAGQWSDPARAEGYWTSSDVPGRPIRLSWGYRLPRRGDTDDNANDDGWSRLTDGDRATFWKSNPYLDPAALGDGQAHPQWLMLHFRRTVLIDRAVIDWATPWATRYAVQYWSGADDYDPHGEWITFPHGAIDHGAGGRNELVLADRPVATTHVRVLLLAASGTAPDGARDWRDRAGFAVREVAFGTAGPDGRLSDAVVHAPSHAGQTVAHVSSTDPWHRAVDRDPNLEQVGLDRIFASGLGFGGPVMIPTGLLYDTPENEAAELRYASRRHWPVTRIELGEEPDGQYAPPADYGALYLAAVDRLRGIIPGARFGGPSMQSGFTVTELLPEARGYWARRFLDYLKQRGRLGDLGFFSFEFYPFDDICGDLADKLQQSSRMLDEVGRVLDDSGLPRQVPRIISEYGFSAFSGRAESDLPSAVLTAGVIGQWLAGGGSAAYLFGYGPNWPARPAQACAGYGNMMLFMADAAGQAGPPLAAFHAARLVTRDWTLAGGGAHRILPARIEGMADRAVSAWALRRPDGRIAVLVVNRSAERAFDLPLVGLKGGRRAALGGPAQVWRFGAGEYRWFDAEAQSRPVVSRPAVRAGLGAGPVTVHVAPQSVVVVRFGAR
ncbi:hypothetical protein ACFOD9_10270 [Novosphingobium bradum]|uniref:Glycosyl hydrolase family 5 n=1 Tax=Novosphingobium bradum TaxID=1737444 RepID=A0ABV7IRQ8_9SPHN